MLKLDKLRDLNFEGTAEGRPNYVYAASGLVQLGENYYVIADDELHLAIFPCNSNKPGRWVRLFPGQLPLDYKQRKKQKPDLESITYIQPYEFAELGAFFIVPSMSRAKRIMGALIPVNQDGLSDPIPIDFTEIHDHLSSRIQELNIEGVTITEQTVKLFHRGTQSISKSAVIELERSQVLRDLHDTHKLKGKSIAKIREYELGRLSGLELAFTDATSLPDGRTVFLAAAERGKNAYDDGPVAGSAFGVMDKDGGVTRIENFEGNYKLEGITCKTEPGKIEMILVSDTDDQAVPSGLFTATLTD